MEGEKEDTTNLRTSSTCSSSQEGGKVGRKIRGKGRRDRLLRKRHTREMQNKKSFCKKELAKVL
jgi:hypothetical protein